jgi:hypothetical protein
MIEALCAVLLLGSFVYVFAPMRQLVVPHGERKSRLEHLRERKETVYENLRDLNFEFKAGKLPEADYLPMRDAMERDAAAVLAEIEDLEKH